jgi:hypothetical protein
MSPSRTLCIVVAIATVAAITVVVPAIGATYQLSGQLVPDNSSGSKAHVTGGLVGTWTTTSNKTLATKPLIHARGTERFVGCIDVARDGSCAGDPTGSLRLKYEYWAKAGKKTFSWGTCVHPVQSGTGAFKGAVGVVSMVDTPQADGSVRTDYIGNITTPSTAANAARARAAATARCGAR